LDGRWNDELERMWKEVVMVCFKVLFQHFTGGSEEFHEKYVRIIGVSDQELCPGPSKYELGLPVTELRHTWFR
jgi:hypothetical protein